MNAGIDRASPLPYYFQLKELIRADIRAKRLQPGDRIPGDHDLCRQYAVSRTVVRQALAELELEGVIERIKGRGTFIAAPKTTEGLVQSITGLYDDVRSRGSTLRSIVRRFEVLPASEQVREELALGPSDRVIVLERLRLVDEKPWVYAVTHLPADLAPGLLEEDLTDQSLYHLLETKYGIVLARGHRSIEAVAASKALAADLGVQAGAPLLALRSVVVDDSGRPVETFVAYHRGDSSRFDVEVGRSGHHGVQPVMRLTTP